MNLISLFQGAETLLIYLISFLTFNYFLIFHIAKIAEAEKNRTIKIFLASLLVGVVGSFLYFVYIFAQEQMSTSFLPFLVVYCMPTLVIFLIIKFLFKTKVLISLILGALINFLYLLYAFPLFLTIGCMDSVDENCGKSYILGVSVLFLILSFLLFAFFYRKEKRSIKTS